MILTFFLMSLVFVGDFVSAKEPLLRNIYINRRCKQTPKENDGHNDLGERRNTYCWTGKIILRDEDNGSKEYHYNWSSEKGLVRVGE